MCRRKPIEIGRWRSGDRCKLNTYGTRMGKTKPAARMRKADRKRQLMHHAKQLFVTLGYQHTTTEKIAQAAGVTEPVLYRHFANKKTLFIEVLDDIRLATILRWQDETARIGDPLKRL